MLKAQLQDLLKDVGSERRCSRMTPWSSMGGLSNWLNNSDIYQVGVPREARNVGERLGMCVSLTHNKRVFPVRRRDYHSNTTKISGERSVSWTSGDLSSTVS